MEVANVLYALGHIAGGDRSFGIAKVSHRFLVAQQLECLLQGLRCRQDQQCGRSSFASDRHSLVAALHTLHELRQPCP